MSSGARRPFWKKRNVMSSSFVGQARPNHHLRSGIGSAWRKGVREYPFLSVNGWFSHAKLKNTKVWSKRTKWRKKRPLVVAVISILWFPVALGCFTTMVKYSTIILEKSIDHLMARRDNHQKQTCGSWAIRRIRLVWPRLTPRGNYYKLNMRWMLWTMEGKHHWEFEVRLNVVCLYPELSVLACSIEWSHHCDGKEVAHHSSGWRIS